MKREHERLLELAKQGDVEAAYRLITLVRRGQVNEVALASLDRAMTDLATSAMAIREVLVHYATWERGLKLKWIGRSNHSRHLCDIGGKHLTMCRRDPINGEWIHFVPADMSWPWWKGTGREPKEGQRPPCKRCLHALQERDSEMYDALRDLLLEGMKRVETNPLRLRELET